MGLGMLCNNALHGHRYKGLSRDDTVELADSFNSLSETIQNLRGQLAAQNIESQSDTATNNARTKPCANCIHGPEMECDRLCCYTVNFDDLYEPRTASPVA